MSSHRRTLLKLISATSLPLLAASLSTPTLAHDDDHDNKHGKSPKVVPALLWPPMRRSRIVTPEWPLRGTTSMESPSAPGPPVRMAMLA